MKKIAQKTLLSLIVLSSVESVFALDSGSQNLTTVVGATDYFKVTCSGETDHLNFKLLENAVAETSVVAVSPITTIPAMTVIDTPPELKPLSDLKTVPQFLNVTLTIAKLSSTVSKIAASSNKDLSLKGGNGSYSLKIDTIGTDSTLKNPQTYSVQYQCLNSVGKVTTGSSTVSGSLTTGKTKTYTIKCSKSKTTGDTSSLKLKITNKTAITKSISAASVIETPPSGNLTAQIIKGQNALNTTGELLVMQGGNGDYSIMVNSPINTARNYRFQYSCLNTSGIETKTSSLQTIQDQ